MNMLQEMRETSIISEETDIHINTTTSQRVALKTASASLVSFLQDDRLARRHRWKQDDSHGVETPEANWHAQVRHCKFLSWSLVR